MGRFQVSKWCHSWLPLSSASEYPIASWRRRRKKERKKEESVAEASRVFFSFCVLNLRNIKHPEGDLVCGLWVWTGEMEGTEGREDRSLAETPTWAFATVVAVMVAFGFFFHFSLKHFKKVKRASLSIFQFKSWCLVFCFLLFLMNLDDLSVTVVGKDQEEISTRCSGEDEGRLGIDFVIKNRFSY